MPLPDRTNWTAWGLPPSTASRRDTEEMLARVSRSENESGDAYRRIEDQLRGVARRLDSSERSQSESNRVLSKTAAEMNIAAREQTQAFDQLGQSVMAVSERLEALEHARAQDGLKDAVKGLHLGLTRLADQISTTANQSASQISMVAGNLEQVATQLVDVRTDSENTARALDQRLVAVERLAHSGADAIDHAVGRLEQRLGVIEKSTGDIIGRGLERLEQRLGMVEQACRRHRRAGPGKTASAARAWSRSTCRRDRGARPGKAGTAARHQIEHAAGEVVSTALAKARAAPGHGRESRRTNRLRRSIMSNSVWARWRNPPRSATGAIDHALDKLDSHANERAGDRAEFERHSGQMQDALSRLEGWIGRRGAACHPACGTRSGSRDQRAAGQYRKGADRTGGTTGTRPFRHGAGRRAA